MSDTRARADSEPAEPVVAQRDRELAALYEVTRLLTSTAGV